tara:strand:+ start:564 stop:1202 length:639 start_codon:yes stop_codon:yes gene_type:complete
MSTIKSSSENLTLNADGANNDIIFQSNGSTKATLDQAGLLTATSFAGSGANLVMPRFREFDRAIYATETSTTATSQTALNISGSTYVTLTPEHVNDIFEFQFQFDTYASDGYIGWGIQRATNTGFTAGVTTVYANGVHSSGRRGTSNDDTYVPVEGSVTALATGLSANTPYYFRLIGQNHSVAATFKWGVNVGSGINPAAGIVYSARRWSIV